MNAAHLHLLVNHVPLFLILFAALSLAGYLWRHNKDYLFVSIALLVLGGIFAIVAVQTGEGAEEVLQRYPGISRGLIHDHEEAAEFAQLMAIGLAVLSLGLWPIAKAKLALARKLAGGLLILSLIALASLVRVANLGGEIRHLEIRSDASPVSDMH